MSCIRFPLQGSTIVLPPFVFFLHSRHISTAACYGFRVFFTAALLDEKRKRGGEKLRLALSRQAPVETLWIPCDSSDRGESADESERVFSVLISLSLSLSLSLLCLAIACTVEGAERERERG